MYDYRKYVIVNFEPDRYVECAVRRTFIVRLAEKSILLVRKIKDRIANSKRLAWYMEKTNHKSSKVKWAKRMLCLPLLLFYKEDKE